MDKDKVNPNNVTDSFRSDATGRADARRNTNPASGAASTLAAAEQSATRSTNAVTGQASAQQSESSFTNKVVGAALPGSKVSATLKGKGKKKGKKGPITILLLVLSLLGVGIFGGQALMPFSIVGNLIDNFNSINTVMNRRGTNLMRVMIDTNRVKNPVKGAIFGYDKFKVRGRQAERLNKQGIQLVEAPDTNGRVRTVMEFSPPDGSAKMTIVADAKAKNLYPGSVSFDEAIKVQSFSTSYTEGSLTWRGKVAGWFDAQCSALFRRLGWTKNLFEGVNPNDKQEVANRQNRERTIDNGDQKFDSKRGIDAEGDDYVSTDKNTATTDTSNRVTPTESPDARFEKLKSRFSRAADISGFTQMAANIGCMVLKAVGGAAMALAAFNAGKLIGAALGFLEAVQKTMAGDGHESPMNDYMNSLVSGPDNGMDSALGSIYSDTQANGSDPGVQKRSILSGGDLVTTIQNGAIAAGASIASFTACNIAKIVATAVTTVISFIPGVGQGFKLLDALGGLLLGGALAVGIGFAIEAMKDWAISMFGTVISDLVGADLGNVIFTGSQQSMARNHQTGGGSYGTKSEVVAYNRVSQQVLAEQAEYERNTRSPFDVTSQHTFLGSIFNTMVPVSASIVGGSGIMSSISSVMSRSFASITGVAYAVDDANFVAGIRTDCPFLKDVGVAATAFCEPYIVSDMSTINADPADIVTAVSNGLEDPSKSQDPDNPDVKVDSDLARYIIACTQRESFPGLVDDAIVSATTSAGAKLISGELTGNSIADGALNGFLGALPGGDVIDIIQAGISQAHVDWGSGKNCVAGSDGWNSNMANYQRYTEDQRMLVNMGIVDEENSPVARLLDKYYEAFPVDNSEAGIIARYWGTNKEDSEQILADYHEYQFLEDYNPVAYGPSFLTTDPEPIEFDDQSIIATASPAATLIALLTPAELRGRTATV